LSTSSLCVEFATEEDFRREYASNIANGGVFIASEDSFEVRDVVRVQLHLAYCGRRFEFDAEVVHCIPSQMAGAGAQPGVALQFQADAAKLRTELESLAGPMDTGDERASGSGRRAALRSAARVPVQLRLSDGSWVSGRSRNLSSSGMLLVVPGQTLPVGEAVTVKVRNPTADEELVVDGVVARHVRRDGDEVVALGIEFDLPASERDAAHEFVSRVRRTEHTRRLGGIRGPIGELGVENLLAMFGSAAAQGTLRLTHDVYEGFVAFEKGLFRGAEAAGRTGLEALAVLLTWQEGTFELETYAEAGLPEKAPLTLEVAIREAAQESVGCAGPASAAARPGAEPDRATPAEDLDPDPDPDADVEFEIELDFEVELDPETTDDSVAAEVPQRSRAAGDSIGQVDFTRLPPDATLSIDQVAVDAACGDLGKIEEALIDLATVGLTVAKALDVIPEPAEGVHRALSGLVDRGLILVGA
jgi:Tfp pilus assembly protein PilZ